MNTVTRPSFDDYVGTRSRVLLRFAYLLCGDRHLAEDLVQEVLIKAHRRWEAIEAENPEAYLKQALVRTHLSWVRRRASSEISMATVAEEASASSFDEAHASRDELWAMLSRLPRTQRAVLVLRYFEDLDDASIAQVVGLSPNTIRVHAHRGLQALRETLRARADDAPTGAELVAKIRRGADRAIVRRRIVTAAGLAAIVLAVALAVPFLLTRGRGPAPIAPTPTPTVELTPVVLTAPVFPYTFNFIPVGAGDPHVDLQPTSERAGWTTLSFGDTLIIGFNEFPNHRGNGREDGTSSQVTVNGVAATAWTYPDSTKALEWQQDGLWFRADSAGTVSLDDLVHFADGMRPGSTAGTPNRPIDAIRSVPVPAGYELTMWIGTEVCWWQESRQGGLVCVSLLTDPPAEPHLRDFTIDGDPAYTAGPELLYVERSDGRIVQIQAGAMLTDDDVIAIYRGIVFSSTP